ncbi:MAG: hypothetical protein ACODAJ_12555 [Planctomycetota bacterium]
MKRPGGPCVARHSLLGRCWLLALLLALAAAGCGEAADREIDPAWGAEGDPAPQEALLAPDDEVDIEPAEAGPAWRDEEAIDLIAVRERDPWLLAVAAPVAATLTEDGRGPLLVAVVHRPLAESALVRRLTPRRCLVLGSARTAALHGSVRGLPAELVRAAAPTEAAAALAARFWGTSEGAVLASATEPEALILGAALAAQRRVPFLPIDEHTDAQTLGRHLAVLGVERPIVATSRPAVATSRRLVETDAESTRQRLVATVAARVEPKPQVLGPQALEHALIDSIGAENVRTVVVTRAAGGQGEPDALAWLAPWVSATRGAPIVLCDSDDAREAEQRVRRLVRRHRLRPRSVTILASYGSIGVISLTGDGRLDGFEVDVEPCAATRPARRSATPGTTSCASPPSRPSGATARRPRSIAWPSVSGSGATRSCLSWRGSPTGRRGARCVPGFSGRGASASRRRAGGWAGSATSATWRGRCPRRRWRGWSSG